MEDEDINLKRARESADYAVLQDKVENYKTKLINIQNKEYQGKYQGINIKMKGDFTMLSTSIDQSYYETASCTQIEHGFLICYTNLHDAIVQEQKDITEQMQAEIARYQATAINNK
ncbi:MAG: hypothetical protein WCR67_00060 [Bacilli bacterium]